MITAIAKRYARALFEVAPPPIHESLVRDLAYLKTALTEEAEIIRFFENPLYSLEQRKSLITDLFLKIDGQAYTLNLLFLLIEKGRIQKLTEIAEEFSQLVDTAQGMVTVQIVAAEEVSKPQLKKVQKQFEAVLAKKVRLVVIVDPGLIGGYVTRINNVILDDSIKGHLEQLRNTLM